MNKGQFKKGQPRPPNAGRKPGTPNKRTEFVEMLEEKNFDPVAKVLEVMPQLHPGEQAKLSMDMLPYVYPKKKQSEVSMEAIVTTKSPEEIERDRETSIQLLISSGNVGARLALDYLKERGVKLPDQALDLISDRIARKYNRKR